jgi:hypothetical protein
MPTFIAKAVLTIDGDLSSMCDEWNPHEMEVSRRLVGFKRSQQGRTITATFSAVLQEERLTNDICISCIYWARRGEYYVTSVDTISLLEALVAVRFTVEEKNRIRRNLQGFKPYTVSKKKDECDDIFQLIMGFPTPKPRSIEKDIKIFPWASLGQALKKIIGKYVSDLCLARLVDHKLIRPASLRAKHRPSAGWSLRSPSDAARSRRTAAELSASEVRGAPATADTVIEAIEMSSPRSPSAHIKYRNL